jgi:branched-subunit amino acid transport protein
MIPDTYLYILLGMGIVTYVPRWLPLALLSNRRLPEWFEQWLDLIPAAILSALILPILITAGEPRRLDLLRPELFVAVPTLLFAVKTRSLAGTVVVGMLLFWLAGIFT